MKPAERRHAGHPRKKGVLYAVLATCLFAAACDFGGRPVQYFGADAITARVVDSDSGAPVADAKVIAAWGLLSGLDSNPRGYVTVLEAVTDANGRFQIPAWGPKASNERGVIDSSAPVLTIFKSGYAIGMGGNARKLDDSPLHMTSEWNGKELKLKRFVGTADEYAGHLYSTLTFRLESLQRYGCHATSVPKFLLAVDRQSHEFDAQRTTKRIMDLEYLSNSFANTCGPIAALVREAGRRT